MKENVGFLYRQAWRRRLFFVVIYTGVVLPCFFAAWAFVFRGSLNEHWLWGWTIAGAVVLIASISAAWTSIAVLRSITHYRSPIRLLRPKRILLVLPRWIGDMILSTPFIVAISELYDQEDVAFDILVPRGTRDLLESERHRIDNFRNIIEYDRKKNGLLEKVSSTMQTVQLLSRGEYDLAILLTTSWRMGLITSAAGIPRRFGYKFDSVLDKFNTHQILLTDSLYAPNYIGHRNMRINRVQTYLMLAQYLGYDRNDGVPSTDIVDSNWEVTKALLEEKGLMKYNNPLYVCIAPGASKEEKRYPSEYFVELVKHFYSDSKRRFKIPFVFTFGPGESKLRDDIFSRLDTYSEIIPLERIFSIESWESNLGIIASLYKHSLTVITNDSGPMHLSLALGTRTLGICGVTPKLYYDYDHRGQFKALTLDDPNPTMEHHNKELVYVEARKLIDGAVLSWKIDKLLRSVRDNDSRSLGLNLSDAILKCQVNLEALLRDIEERASSIRNRIRHSSEREFSEVVDSLEDELLSLMENRVILYLLLDKIDLANNEYCNYLGLVEQRDSLGGGTEWTLPFDELCKALDMILLAEAS